MHKHCHEDSGKTTCRQKTDIKQTGTKERGQPRKQKEINSGKAGIYMVVERRRDIERQRKNKVNAGRNADKKTGRNADMKAGKSDGKAGSKEDRKVCRKRMKDALELSGPLARGGSVGLAGRSAVNGGA
jgi:hypothetical protein